MKNENYIKKRNKKGQSLIIFQKKNSKGQFYFMATIIIIGLIIGLAVIFNYSTKSNSYEAEEIAKELSIESEKVIDYDIFHSSDEFEINFAKDYSSYVGKDKEIYFIFVNGEQKEAYKYTGGIKNDLTSYLDVIGEEIRFSLDNRIYVFKLEDGKNFYFLVVYNKRGERYVFSG